jgi:hypothetical protein
MGAFRMAFASITNAPKKVNASPRLLIKGAAAAVLL